jgi:hypothetical protein
MALTGLGIFLGLNGFQYIAGLGDVREIDLGRDGLRRAGSRDTPAAAWAGAPLKMRTHLLGLMVFQ